MKYFDYAATTPVDPAVYEAMKPYFSDRFYNASSLYGGGRNVHADLEKARDQVAGLLAAPEGRVIFTSGGTEADNLALIGTAFHFMRTGSKRKRILISAIEHHAVLESCLFLERLGFTVERLPVDTDGRLLSETLRDAIGEDVLLVSVMWVNNELGTIQNIPVLSGIAHEYGALFHTDSVQAIGTQPVDAKKCGADMISVSGHKIYGPQGSGALWVRNETLVDGIQHGGQQENGLRGGTENIPALVGFGKAAELLKSRRDRDSAVMADNRRYLAGRFQSPDIRINTPMEISSPSVLNVAFRNIEAEAMLFYLDRKGFCLSMGAACNSQSVEPSHVMRAVHVPDDFIRGCVRISFGRGQTRETVEELAMEMLTVFHEAGAYA